MNSIKDILQYDNYNTEKMLLEFKKNICRDKEGNNLERFDRKDKADCKRNFTYEFTTDNKELTMEQKYDFLMKNKNV